MMPLPYIYAYPFYNRQVFDKDMEIDHVSNKIIYHALYAVTFGKYHADDWKHILSRLPPSPQVDRMETMMSWENKHL